MDHASAVSALGSELAQSLRSLVADMREALYLEELADVPRISEDRRAVLQFALGFCSWLEAEPVGQFTIASGNWRQSHRLKLLHVYKEGSVCI